MSAERRESLRRARPQAITFVGGCPVAKPARSPRYYRRRSCAAEKIVLHQRIAELTTKFSRHKYWRVTYQLRAEGLLVNHKAMARILRESGFHLQPLCRFVRTTQSDHEKPNLTCEFTPSAPNQLRVSQLTYLAIAVGFVYVAVILDAWSRRVVGYALSKRIDTSWRWRCCGPRLKRASLRPVAFITRSAAHEKYPRLTARCLRTAGCEDRYGGAPIPTTTRKPKAL